MKSYPTIKTHRKMEHEGDFCIAFDKLDGSNIRVEFDKRQSKKGNGFNKFGTRTQILDMNGPFAEVPGMFMQKHSEQLDRIFNTDKLFRDAELITVYLEYFGENSFAGMHVPEDKKELFIIDAFIYKKDFVKPKDFIETFHMLDIPKVIYSGIYDYNLVKSIQDNVYNLKEGVVTKGILNNKVWMNKIKTFNWLEQVKDKLGIERYNEEL